MRVLVGLPAIYLHGPGWQQVSPGPGLLRPLAGATVDHLSIQVVWLLEYEQALRWLWIVVVLFVTLQ